MKNILVVGASGRMGQKVIHILHEKFPKAKLVGFGRRPVANCETCLQSPKQLADYKFDVVIDFSTPKVFSQILKYCYLSRTPLVSGTTALTSAQKKQMKKASLKTAILWSANMSMGIATMAKMLGQFRALRGWDVQIIESHHRLKKDSPSGTALLLKEKLNLSKQVPISSFRVGGVVGEHSVIATSRYEKIEIKHQALSREVFADGAILCAEWIVRQPKGLYSIFDLYE